MFTQIIKLIRIPQWIKNFFVFVPLVFSLNLFHKELLFTTLLGFFIFCLTSSVVYIINDIVDADADRAHPVKKLRPIASRKISPSQGIIIAAVFTLFIVLLCIGLNSPFIFLLIFRSHVQYKSNNIFRGFTRNIDSCDPFFILFVFCSFLLLIKIF